MAEHVVHHEGGSNGMGFLLGVILLIGFAVVLWFWGVPMLRQNAPAVVIPESPTINVPSEIDVNINQEPAPQE